jgi:hypothetical protein
MYVDWCGLALIGVGCCWPTRRVWHAHQAANYGDYLKQFVDVVKPNMLSTDHYPDFDESTSSNKTKPGYILNLLALREASLSVTPPIPFWNFFNAMPYGRGSSFDISEAELRWQA